MDPEFLDQSHGANVRDCTLAITAESDVARAEARLKRDRVPMNQSSGQSVMACQ
jgi:hypothetical protein